MLFYFTQVYLLRWILFHPYFDILFKQKLFEIL